MGETNGNGPKLKRKKKTPRPLGKKKASKWGKYLTAGAATLLVGGLAACGDKNKDDIDGGATDATVTDALVDGGVTNDGSKVDGSSTDGGVSTECLKTESAVAHLGVSPGWGQYENVCSDVGECLTGVKVGDMLTLTLADSTVENWEVVDVSEAANGTIVLSKGNAEIEANSTGSVYIEGGSVQSTEICNRGKLTVNAVCVEGRCGGISTEVPERAGMALVEASYMGGNTKRLLLTEGETATVEYDDIVLDMTLRRATPETVYVSWSVNTPLQNDEEPLGMPLAEGETVSTLGVDVSNIVSVDNNDAETECVTKSVTLGDTNNGTTLQYTLEEGQKVTTQSGVEFTVESVMVELNGDGSVNLENSAVELTRGDGEKLVLRGGETQDNLNGGSLNVAGFYYDEIQPETASPDAGVDTSQ